jgi:sulfate transport system substrate-binding protein
LRLLNVSYDPTRELYEAYNTAFARHWLTTKGQSVVIRQSHGGSGKQARAVMDGLEADIVTLALAHDIDMIANDTHLLPVDWESRAPLHSSPYTSTIVFLVRKGNPRGLHDWPDLARAGVGVIAPNPKTSGGARWAYLAAWGFGLLQPGGSEARARTLVQAIYKNVVVLDSGARGSTTSFVQNGLGDVLVCWENEAHLVLQSDSRGEFELVVPSRSILAEPSVAWVDRYVDAHGTRAAAEEYVRYLYSDEGQEIAATNFYRPRSEAALARHADQFPKLELFTIEDTFGGWKKAHATHFAEGGSFDQLYQVTR